MCYFATRRMLSILPYRLNMPYPRLGRLLFDRYLFATWLCFLTEYQLLTIFLVYQLVDVTNPLDWLLELVDQVIFSLYTVARVQLLGIHMATYGLLLCRLHERLPSCHSWRLHRLQGELPIKLCQLVVLISLGYFSSWLYLKYMSELAVDVDFSYTGHYLLMNGVFCGLAYFLSEDLCLGKEVWPLPLIRFETATWQWLRWHHFDFSCSLPRSMLYTAVFAAIYWPNMSGDFKASFQLIGLSTCITTLITVKLHAIKRVFGTVMHSELPLTLQKQPPQQQQTLPQLTRQHMRDRRLPVSLMLSVSNQLYGFQLQVARDFYTIVSSPKGETCKLFQLQGFLGRQPKNWTALRNVLLGNMRQFMDLLNDCLDAPGTKCKQLPTRYYAGMRRLAPPTAVPKVWSRRCCGEQPAPAKQLCRSLWQQLQLKLQSWQLQQKLQCFCKCFFFDATHLMRSDKQDCELCVGRPLVWLVPGLVCICVRSLEEDRHGVLQQDLETIFKALNDLQKQIFAVLRLLHLQQQEPCATLKTLSQTLTLSLNKMIFHFGDYLSFIINDKELQHTLECRE
ncbi:nucleoporin Ndc1 [Drosophila hydei]|uniref:Nucleoporin Ndc1 n=1 Tax=Drosophila hydei TaxID=7224 RepID=A0A6J1LVK8_DROHY|nr:nucleoporin Ndc1 [Drosophila hydei]